MKARHIAAASLVALALALPAHGAELPPAKEGDWIAKDFHFHTGEVLPELKLHYTTLGSPSGEPVLVLHGTTGTGKGLLLPEFGGELFGPGQVLDAAKYYIIMPDSIGHGQSSKPSDGLKAKFPQYDYADAVEAQYQLLTAGLGVKHLRLVIGNSMGGMQTWLWGETHPDMMDGLVPMASQPTAMASRNWMMRRMLIETIRADPDYQGGNYTRQPPMLRIANVFFGFGTSGGSMGYQQQAPTTEKADELVNKRLASAPPPDANDYIYQWASSHDYDADPDLAKIKAPVLAINSADDERNPPETGIMDREIKKLSNGHYYLIPESADTRGHGTVGIAKFWTANLQTFLSGLPESSGLPAR